VKAGALADPNLDQVRLETVAAPVLGSGHVASGKSLLFSLHRLI
jgi:hypothetical protein